MTFEFVDRFLSLNCATDILKVVSPIKNMSKEISEAYTMLQSVKKVVHPADSNKYEVLDLCAGNGLLGVTLAHVMNFKSVTSMDIRVPGRKWEDVRTYSYLEKDIHTLQRHEVEGKVIVANHPCQRASHVVDLFCKFDAKAVVIMPCCVGQLKSRPEHITKQFGKYGAWCMDLYDTIGDWSVGKGQTINARIYENKHCLSPKNVTIVAWRY